MAKSNAKSNAKPKPKKAHKATGMAPDRNKKGHGKSATGTYFSPVTPNSKLSSLQQSFARKLEGARFRAINEKLYTMPGDQAYSEFQQDPSQFDIYHKGFREQCAQWPYNPLDGIIDFIRSKHPRAVVADLGCGDARLAASLPKNKVHSFDLVSTNPAVVACDIAHLPLQNNSVDIVVFCLALMGTNIAEFIKEAHRILKPNGIMKIAEVRSRFESAENPQGIKAFVRFLKKAGFDSRSQDPSVERNKMFFELEVVKTNRPGTIDESFTAKACLYKKR